MPTKLADLLAKADAIELFSLEPEKETGPDVKEFHGFAVLGSTVVKDRQAREKIRSELLAAVTLRASDRIGVCFSPRHGLRVTVQSKSLEVGICFECSRLEAYLDGKQVAVLSVGDSAQSYFDSVLKAAKVPLARKPEKTQVSGAEPYVRRFGTIIVNWLYPRFPVGRWPVIIRTAFLGAILAGGYGAAHDQVSFAISEEYFTKLKFRQFAWADIGLPPRLFATEVGFLATWWVGLIAGWLVARAGLAEVPVNRRPAYTARTFAIVLAAAPIAGLIGGLIGAVVTHGSDLHDWDDWQQSLGIEDLRAFVIVAYLHAGGYLGALLGLILAIVYVRRALSQIRRIAAGRSESQ